MKFTEEVINSLREEISKNDKERNLLDIEKILWHSLNEIESLKGKLDSEIKLRKMFQDMYEKLDNKFFEMIIKTLTNS